MVIRLLKPVIIRLRMELTKEEKLRGYKHVLEVLEYRHSRAVGLLSYAISPQLVLWMEKEFNITVFATNITDFFPELIKYRPTFDYEPGGLWWHPYSFYERKKVLEQIIREL